MATYLAPVDKPRGLVLRILYALSRRQFGKVPTPLTVFSARMPIGFTSFYGKVSRLDRKLAISPETAVLIREHVASINQCHFCMDAARWFAMQQSPANAARLDALDDYRTSALFTEAQRSALDFADELTRDKVVSSETFSHLTRHFSEREICELAWLVASEHLYNMSNISLNIGSDGFCTVPTPANTDTSADDRRSDRAAATSTAAQATGSDRVVSRRLRA